MANYIFVRGNGKTRKVTAREGGTINDHTLRSAFLLRHDVPIGLFRNGIALTVRHEANEYIFELEPKWSEAEFEIEWSGALPVVPIDKGAKRQRIEEPELKELPLPIDGELIERVKSKALYYVREDGYKRCAVPVTENFAATFWHGDNKSLKLGDEIVIRFCDDARREIKTRVVKFIEKLDVILLQSDKEHLSYEPYARSVKPRQGMRYLMLGFSIPYGDSNKLSLSNGTIESNLAENLRYRGSDGSFQFDSGAICCARDGYIMGMKVDAGKGGSSSSFEEGQCYIVSYSDILEFAQDLIPADPDRDMEFWMD